jgi:hypothetical protein
MMMDNITFAFSTQAVATLMMVLTVYSLSVIGWGSILV